MEVRLFNYSNPTGRCRDCYTGSNEVSCCDSNHVGTCEEWRQCDSYFIYCLRPPHLNNTERGCFGFENRTSNVNRNDETLNFSSGMLLGLPNPIRLQGLTEAYAVSLFLCKKNSVHLLSLKQNEKMREATCATMLNSFIVYFAGSPT